MWNKEILLGCSEKCHIFCVVPLKAVKKVLICMSLIQMQCVIIQTVLWHPIVQHSADKRFEISSASRDFWDSLGAQVAYLRDWTKSGEHQRKRHWKTFSIWVSVFRAVGTFINLFFTPNFCWWIQFEKAVGEFNLINPEIKYSSISKTK